MDRDRVFIDGEPSHFHFWKKRCKGLKGDAKAEGARGTRCVRGHGADASVFLPVREDEGSIPTYSSLTVGHSARTCLGKPTPTSWRASPFFSCCLILTRSAVLLEGSRCLWSPTRRRREFLTPQMRCPSWSEQCCSWCDSFWVYVKGSRVIKDCLSVVNQSIMKYNL